MHSSAKSPSAGTRVIIADDHELLRKAIRTKLDLAPDLLVVDEAKDGQETVELCRVHCPDLVLMDIRMPRMDGWEATKAIKAELPATKILIVSAAHIGITESVNKGADAYVSKLATLEELLDAIRCVLGGTLQHS